MNSEAAANCEKIRRNFENREAIYIEKGVLRVRISNIQADVTAGFLTAHVEEIPTRGLEKSFFHGQYLTKSAPYRWTIGSGIRSMFSDHCWDMGYGGWSLYFATRVVEGIVELASRWPETLDAYDRYDEVLRWLTDHNADDASRRVNPEYLRANFF